MKTAAHILTQDQYLQISDNTNFLVTEDNSQPSQKDVSTSFVGDGLFNEVSPLFYRTRVRLSFSLAEEFRSLFIVTKGLIEFYRSKDFLFYYNREQRTIETDIEISQLTELRQFLKKVSAWLKEEIRFKDALKKVLKFEAEYKLQKEEVYGLFKSITTPGQVSR